jgi:hypothetical protein
LRNFAALGAVLTAGLFGVFGPFSTALNAQQFISTTVQPLAGGRNRVTITFAGPPMQPAPPVLRAPYSAVQLDDRIETTTTGGHIAQHMHTWILYRDSTGRRRMETPIVITPGGHPAFSVVEIRDYVGGYEFTLDPVNRIAHRMKRLPHGSEPSLTVLPAHSEYPTEDVPQSSLATLRSESLGSKVIEGITTSGSRAIRSVPAGAGGNDQAVTYVSEDWWARELQLLVLSRQVDPAGTAIVRSLTNIRTSEPNTELFVVPADYKIVDETGRFDVTVTVADQSH